MVSYIGIRLYKKLQEEVGKDMPDEEQSEVKRWDDRVDNLWERLNYEQHLSPLSSVTTSLIMDEGVMYYPQGDYWGFEKWLEEDLDSDLHSLAKEEKQKHETRLQEQLVEEEEGETITSQPSDYQVDSEQMSSDKKQFTTDTGEDDTGEYVIIHFGYNNYNNFFFHRCNRPQGISKGT